MTRSDAPRTVVGTVVSRMDASSAENNFNFKPNKNTVDFEWGLRTSTNCTLESQDTVSNLPSLSAHNSQASVSVMLGDFAQLSVHEKEAHEEKDNITMDDGMNSSLTSQQAAKNLLLYLPDEDGDTALHISIMREDDPKTIYIIKCAPDFVHLNTENNLGQAPVHLAALTNSSKILRKLMCAGADISFQDKDAYTPLHIACQNGYREVVKQLLKPIDYEETLGNRYAIPYTAIPQNMNMKNFDGHTCLHLSVLQSNVDISRLLVESGADVNLGDSKSGRSSLHLAAEQGSLEMVSLFLSYPGTNVCVENYAGHTPAQLAFSRGHIEVTHLLIRTSSLHPSQHWSYLLDVDDDSDNSDADMDY